MLSFCHHLQYTNFMLQGKNAANEATDGCVRTFDVMVPKVHQHNRSYVSSADLPSDSLHENLAWWAVTRRALKNHKTVKNGGGACSGQYGIILAALKVMHVNTCLLLLHARHKTMDYWINAAQLVSMPHTEETKQQESS